MSAELDFALSLLGGAKVHNPKTGKPYTEAEIKALAAKGTAPTVTLQMSDEDTASVNAARKILARTYVSRIEACVKNGQMTPKKAKELSAKYLAPGELRFSFDDEGEHIPGPLDDVLETFESLPKHTLPVKKSQTEAAGYGFSLDTEDQVAPPADVDQDFDVDAVLDMQFKTSGKSAAAVGGYRDNK